MAHHYLINSYIAISGICFAVMLLHLIIFLRLRQERVHLVFAFMALCCTLATVLDIQMHTASDLVAFIWFLKATNTVQVLLWIAFAWFVRLSTRDEGFLTVTLVTGLYVCAGVLNLLLPHGILFDRIDELRAVTLGWGETMVFGSGQSNAWRLLPDLAWFILLAYTMAALMRFHKKGEKQRAWYLGLSTFACLGIGYLNGTLIDLGILKPPSIWNYSFLALILLMSKDLVDSVVKVPRLEHRIAEQLNRWQSLIDNAKLLIFGLDTQGRINFVNPYFLNITGFTESEVLGRSFLDFVPPSEKDEVDVRIKHALLKGVLPEKKCRALVTKTTQERFIQWSHVLLRNHEDGVAGTLSIGEDVTERKGLEAARDRALQALEAIKIQLEEENVELREELLLNKGFEDIVGQSNAILYVLERIKQVAETEATVLIQGETGVGKELVASAIHRASRRADKPFVRLNCAALNPTLIESELFGHVAGAFTGAERRRRGRFEVAHDGTLLLDEISEIPLDLQAKLLRVLQEGQFERVGGSETITVNVRIIATTNRNLQDEVKRGTFRADLYFRLNVYPITVPPLRKRREDIETLTWHFLDEINARVGKNVNQIPKTIMQALIQRDYPGNVRELKNLLENGVITTANNVLHLPELITESVADKTQGQTSQQLISLDDAQRNHIIAVLDHTDGRIEGTGGAAEILQLNPSTLRHRIKKLGIQRDG
jgi:formate hydrogenlyase transcriptional activator